MDCLDRTNVVQSMLARWTLDRMFVDLGLLPRGSRFAQEDPAFELMFRNLWADNADVVSKELLGHGRHEDGPNPPRQADTGRRPAGRQRRRHEILPQQLP